MAPRSSSRKRSSPYDVMISADELASMDQSLTITASHVVANVITLGYPDESGEARESRPRLSKDEIVRWERW